MSTWRTCAKHQMYSPLTFERDTLRDTLLRDSYTVPVATSVTTSLLLSFFFAFSFNAVRLPVLRRRDRSRHAMVGRALHHPLLLPLCLRCGHGLRHNRATVLRGGLYSPTGARRGCRALLGEGQHYRRHAVQYHSQVRHTSTHRHNEFSEETRFIIHTHSIAALTTHIVIYDPMSNEPFLM